MVHLKDAEAFCPIGLAAGEGVIARTQNNVLPSADGRRPFQRLFGEGGAAQGRRGELPVHHMAQGFFRRAMEVRREKGDALCQIPGDLPVFFICQQLFRQRIVKYFCFAGLRMVGPGKQAHPRRHACVVHFNHLI